MNQTMRFVHRLPPRMDILLRQRILVEEQASMEGEFSGKIRKAAISKLDPREPPVSDQQVACAAAIIYFHYRLAGALDQCGDGETFQVANESFKLALCEYADHLKAIFGMEILRQLAPSFEKFMAAAESREWNDASLLELYNYYALLGVVMDEMQKPRR